MLRHPHVRLIETSSQNGTSSWAGGKNWPIDHQFGEDLEEL